jgi:hypothetical protein
MTSKSPQKFILLSQGRPVAFGNRPFTFSFEVVPRPEADTFPDHAAALQMQEKAFAAGKPLTIEELTPEEAAKSTPRPKKVYSLREALDESARENEQAYIAACANNP